MCKQSLKTISILLIGILLIVISYFYIDRQIVWLLAEYNSRSYAVLKLLANDIVFVLTTIIVLYYIYFFVRLAFHRGTSFNSAFILCCNSVAIVSFLKDILKFIFGRYWPETFICNNLSLLKNNVYGFNIFQSADTFTSFPSGHAAFIFSFSVSMWFLFPKFRWLWATLALLVSIGQIAMYYHFVSDVIAGAIVGSFVAFYNIYFHQNKWDKQQLYSLKSKHLV